MSDWEKLKVTELKEELKTRGIPLTGLKLKQQLIDKLIEVESSSVTEDAPVEEATNGALEEVEKDHPGEPNVDEPTVPQITEDSSEDTTRTAHTENEVKDDGILPSDRPAKLKEEDTQAEEEDATEESQHAQDVPMANTAEEAEEIEQNDVLIPGKEQLQTEDPTGESIGDLSTNNETRNIEGHSSDAARDILEARLAQTEQPTKIVNDEERNASPVADVETKEEQRKRKRRSATPVPSEDEVQKKAKGSFGEAIVTKTASPTSRRSRSQSQDSKTSTPGAQADSHQQQAKDTTLRQSPSPAEDGSRSPSNDVDAEPAIHPATRSLYIRNFKRPLHIPTLRSHVSTVAKARSSATDEDPIKFFYLDSIRTHAFITFSNTAAASRVRNAMHGTRFPDEPQREPLWIDFVPDEYVQNWVDQESGGGASGSGAFGRGGAGKGKFEVVYNKDSNRTVHVFLQEVGASNRQEHRPSLHGFQDTNYRSNSFATERSQSYSADPSKTATSASGIHPDRANLVPKSSTLERRQPPRSPRLQDERISRNEPRKEDKTPAFHALSSLFSSTRTKPLLYFKLPSQSVIDERLDMIRHLYPDRGVSGEPGMKRYTFEQIRGQEEWVSNGPEHGHGKKGMDRLVGVPRGGFRGGRGGGAGRGRFGMGDSYRGGGTR